MKLPRVRWSLRALFFFVFLVATVLAWAVHIRNRHQARKEAETFLREHDVMGYNERRAKRWYETLADDDAVFVQSELWFEYGQPELLSYVSLFPEVKSLVLPRHVKDKDIECLPVMRELQRLTGDYCELSDAGLIALCRKTPNLRKLLVNGDAISDKAIAGIQSLENLEHLDLVGTSVSDAGIRRLHNLQSLSSLHLNRTKVRWHFSEDGFASLTTLTIGECDVDDASLEGMRVLPKLEYLDVGCTEVTKEGVFKLCMEKSLKTLVVSEGLVPESFANAPQELLTYSCGN